ncbi:hypothetical protein EZS27_007913 [termite gut metagenome]|uniref:DUF177 domain-containing protein n=1 Tax=termite gut metagenome TaxID=433724 RepID=A0A5J4SEK8_9ZZZZ
MGKFDAYRIDLKGMQADSAGYEYLLDNLFFANIDGPEIRKGKVKVTVTIRKVSFTFELKFRTEGFVRVSCDRCLDEMEQPVESSGDKLIVKFGREYAEESDNLIIIPEKEGSINVAWFMYEFIATAIPMRHIHPPGKCNKAVISKLRKHLRTDAADNEEIDLSEETGNIDIGVEEETAGENEMDPRWNDLKKIVDTN